MNNASTILSDDEHFGINISIITRIEKEFPLCSSEKNRERVLFGYVLEGELELESDIGTAAFSPHTAFILYRGKDSVHMKCACVSGPARFFLLTIPHARVVELLDSEKVSLACKGRCLSMKQYRPLMCRFPASVTAQLLIGQIRNCHFHGPMYSTYLELKGMELVLDYLSQYFIQDEYCCELCTLHSRVSKAWQIMCANLEQPLSISQLAKAVCLSESTLKRVFRNTYGTSIFASFQRHRMNEARKLLESGGLTVAEVSYKVGYASPGHFSRAFSRCFGFPPKSCR